MKWVRCTKGCKGSTLRTVPGGSEFNVQPTEAGTIARVTDSRAQAMVASGRWEFVSNTVGRKNHK